MSQEKFKIDYNIDPEKTAQAVHMIFEKAKKYDNLLLWSGGIGAKELSCSYCGKSQSSVKILIAADNVNICDACVQTCVEILKEDENEKRDE